jgi:hypothetical protein
MDLAEAISTLDIVSIKSAARPRPRSRLGRKQIAVFADPDLVDEMRRLSVARDMSVQQVMGDAIDLFLSGRGYGSPLRSTRLSDTPRRLRAKVRKDVLATRDGKKLIAGWYGRDDVDLCIASAAQIGLRLNEMVVEALRAYGRLGSEEVVPSGPTEPEPEGDESSVDLSEDERAWSSPW